MVALSPVEAWTVEPAWGPTVVGPPYDGLRPEERRRLADSNADSFFNVVRSPVDYGDGPVPGDLLTANSRALDRLLAGGRYRPPERPAVFVYGLEAGGRRQLAVVADVTVAAFQDGQVRAHERTREAKEAELAGHIRHLRMSSSPVGLTYRSSSRVDELVATTTAEAALVDFRAPDGARHLAWPVPLADTAALLAAFAADVASAYIVDGHHRVAAAARVGDPTFLAGLVPHDQLNLLPYHRVVAGPLPFGPGELVARAGAEPAADGFGPGPWPPPGEVRLYVGGAWYRLRLHRPPSTLDVEAVGDQVLGPLAGVRDPRNDPRLDFVPGNADPALLARLADQRAGLAVALHPPSVEQLLTHADAGRTLPPKSTWFEPKLRSGVFVVRRPAVRPPAGVGPMGARR